MKLTGTAKRLVAAFGLLLALFGLAAGVAARGLDRVGETLSRVRAEEERVRTVLQLANAIRDQYAHQAHTILLRNDSHLPMYEAARERVAGLVDALQSQDGLGPAREAVAAIGRDSERMDRIFRSEILPAVRTDDLEQARRAHDDALSLVLHAAAQSDALAAQFEQSIAAFEAKAQVTQRATYRWALGLFLLGIVLSAVVGLYVARSVARPVAALEAGARRLAEGDLDARIQLPRADEFGRLAAQFNAMTESIQAHQAELVRTERLAGIGRLAAGVAHEINNPLGVILGYVRLLRKRADDATAADLKVIDDEVVRAKEIVDGLLDLSRPWNAGSERVDLREVAERAAERLRDAGLTHDVAVQVEGEAEATANDRALQQVVLNLVRNAVEAAGPGGRVSVRVRSEGGGARLEVEDSGPGVAPEALDRLFEPFFTTKPQGTGLGLAVSRAIAEAHGGALSGENRPEGGARFTLSLPERRAAGTTREAAS